MSDSAEKMAERSRPDRVYMPTPDQYVASLGGKSEHVTGPLTQKGRINRPRWGTAAGWGLLTLVVVAAVYVGYIAITVAKISTKPVDLTGLSADSSGRTNVLVLGVGDPGHAGENLSDTIMMLSLDSLDKRVAQISVPRDLRVDIPGHGVGKINEANSDGGPSLAEQTVANTLGSAVNYYVKTDFTGLKDVVNAVGGIDVNVTQRLYDPEYPCDNDQYKVCGLDIQPGPQHMNGTIALEYVRCRKGTCGNDFGRAARQQEVLRLVRAKVLSPAVILVPWRLIPIVNAVRSNVETDMGAVQMVEFAFGWQGASTNHPVSLVLSTSPGGYLVNAGDGSSDLLPQGGSFSHIQGAVADIFKN